MTQGRPKKRSFTIATLVLASLLFGLAAPLFFDVRQINLDFEPSGVVAAPRDQFDVGTPLPLHSLSQTVITTGRLLQVFPTGRKFSGTEAQAILKKGAARLALENAEVQVGGDASGVEGVGDAPWMARQAPIVSALTSLRFLDLTVHQSRIVLNLPGGYREVLDNANLLVTGTSGSTLSISGNGHWRGQDVKILIETGRARPAAAEIPVSFRLDGDLISIKFSGLLQRRGDPKILGDIDVSITRIRAFSDALNVGWPALSNDGEFILRGPVDWSQDAVAFKRASVQLDGNEANGALTLKRNKGLPLLSGTLAFDQFRLARTPLEQQEQHQPKPESWWAWVRRFWSTPMVKFLNADLRLSANEVVVGKTQLGKAAATLSLRHGKLSAQLASLTFDGGSGNGQINMDFNGLAPRTTLRGRLLGAPIGELSSALFGNSRLEGRADVTLDLTTHGSELRPMLESVAGTIDLKLKDSGGVINLDLEALAVEPIARPPAGQISDVPAKLIETILKGKTKLQALDVSIAVDAGRAECVKFVGKFDGRLAQLAGRFDLATQRMDVRGLVHADVRKPDADGKDKPIAPEVAGRQISLRGPWSMPLVELSEVKGRPEDLAAELRKKRTEKKFGGAE